MIEFPSDINRELSALRVEAEKGINYLADKEKEYVLLSLEADKVEALAYLNAGGPIPERQAIAKLQSIDAKQSAELAKVEVNRVKLKLKHLTESQMNVQTQARMIELQFKTAGINEH